jgi:flap endonuclease-1
MGVQISDIIPRKEIELSDLKGKIVAIDAYNALYQFLTTIRQMDGTPLMDSKGDITSHLSGLFYRNINLLQEGIKPVYIFDGKPPELKAAEIKKRKEAKKAAEEKFEEAKAKKDVDGMKKYGGRFVKMTDKIISQSKELLVALGIPVIQAPSEGEAEAATLCRVGKVWAAASQDYDSLLYATPNLIRNMTSPRRKKLSSGLYTDVKMELIEYEKVLKDLNVNREQLICLAILVGTDYNPGGVKGLGQKRALELAQKFETPAEIFEEAKKKYEIVFDWEIIFKQFYDYESPQVEEIKFNPVDEEKVKELLVSHEFSENRIESGLAKLRALKEAKKQTGLGQFF